MPGGPKFTRYARSPFEYPGAAIARSSEFTIGALEIDESTELLAEDSRPVQRLRGVANAQTTPLARTTEAPGRSSTRQPGIGILCIVR
jgi:hypothetical protein